MTTASANQLGYIERLVVERVKQLDVPNADAFMHVLRERRITSEGASSVIDRLLALRPDPREVVAVANGAPAKPVRSNGYPGSCADCGQTVAARAGSLEGGPGRWITRHLPGECPAAPAKAPTCSLIEILDGIPDGRFAIPSVTGSNDLTFFQVWTNKGVYNPAKKGQRGVTHIVGGAGEQLKVSTAWIEKAANAVRAAGVNESIALFGQHIGSCGFCSTDLTRKYSRQLGYGPSCARKHGLPFDHTAYRASEIISDGKGE